MPRKGSIAIADDTIVMCIESHYTNRFWRVGSRVKRSEIDPYIESLWAPDGSSDSEIAHRRYLNTSEALNPTYYAGEYTGPRPAPPPSMVRCTKPVTVNTSASSSSAVLEGSIAGHVPAIVSIGVGDVLADNHPLVAQFPDCFTQEDDGE